MRLKGGGEVVTSGSVDCYNTSTRVWSMCDQLEEGRSSAGAAVVGENIYLLGGLKKRRIVTSCCIYDVEKDLWSEVTGLPARVASFTTVVLGEDILIVGGVGHDFRCVDTTYIYNTETGEWREGGRIKIARKNAAGFYYDRFVFEYELIRSRLGRGWCAQIHAPSSALDITSSRGIIPAPMG